MSLTTSIAFQDGLESSMEALAEYEEGTELRESYLPILDNDDNEMVFVDVDTGEVFRWDIEGLGGDGTPMLRRIGDDLESVVRIWIEVLDSIHVTFRPGQVYLEVQRSQFPTDLVDRRICRV